MATSHVERPGAQVPRLQTSAMRQTQDGERLELHPHDECDRAALWGGQEAGAQDGGGVSQ